MPKFSVILPSYLGKYRYMAKDPEKKIVRAIDSVLGQKDFELVVVSDGCDRTVDIVRAEYSGVKELKLFRTTKERKISKNKRNAGAAGIPRNAGIQNATGEYIIYLDHDDYYEDGYLESLGSEMTDHDWYWFDNLSWNERTGEPDLYTADINVQGQCGTANVCHRRSLGVGWEKNVHYLHDWWFVNALKVASKKYEKLVTAGYVVCHVPHLLDV